MAIFLDQLRKVVHDAVYSDADGVGITGCGRLTFLVGTRCLKRESEFGAPAKDESDGTWTICRDCQQEPDIPKRTKKLAAFRKVMRDTFQIMARSQVAKSDEALRREIALESGR